MAYFVFCMQGSDSIEKFAWRVAWGSNLSMRDVTCLQVNYKILCFLLVYGISSHNCRYFQANFSFESSPSTLYEIKKIHYPCCQKEKFSKVKYNPCSKIAVSLHEYEKGWWKSPSLSLSIATCVTLSISFCFQSFRGVEAKLHGRLLASKGLLHGWANLQAVREAATTMKDTREAWMSRLVRGRKNLLIALA